MDPRDKPEDDVFCMPEDDIFWCPRMTFLKRMTGMDARHLVGLPRPFRARNDSQSRVLILSATAESLETSGPPA